MAAWHLENHLLERFTLVAIGDNRMQYAYVYTVKQQLMEFFIQELVDRHKTASSIYFLVFHYNFDFF